MVLGLTPEAFVVLQSSGAGPVAAVTVIDGDPVFFSSFNAAKAAAEAYIANFEGSSSPMPKYIWVQAITKLWVNGVS